MGVWLSAAAAVTHARTTILVEFTADGQCSIAVRGDATAGSRAEMSYRPSAPGRCAIPAVRDEGPVTLTVLLPRGVEPPRRSTPPLTWHVEGGRASGVADLASPPAFVDVMPSSGSALRRVSGWVFLAVAVALAAWSAGRALWPRSGRQSPGSRM